MEKDSLSQLVAVSANGQPASYCTTTFTLAKRDCMYELSRVARREAWELGFHFESGDKQLNRFLLQGFRRHLFEIKDVLGEQFEAEMWDKGWSKIYEVVPVEPYTEAYQAKLGHRLAEVITCLHPVFVDLRSQAAKIKR